MGLTNRFAKVKFNDHSVVNASNGISNFPRDRVNLTEITSNYYIFSLFQNTEIKDLCNLQNKFLYVPVKQNFIWKRDRRNNFCYFFPPLNNMDQSPLGPEHL